MPWENNSSELLKAEVSISKYIGCFFFSIKNKAQLVAAKEAISIGGVLGKYSMDSFAEARHEEALLAYYLANQNININYYQDLVELACNLK
ncbi:hypothetical protein [Aeromonas sp. 604443]|uniref:hypothetical protein n=1 Tax=Aeromonas sp. 604443 TaxID=2712054 RepID=UPI003BA2A835